jgi:hypothetical protein
VLLGEIGAKFEAWDDTWSDFRRLKLGIFASPPFKTVFKATCKKTSKCLFFDRKNRAVLSSTN